MADSSMDHGALGDTRSVVLALRTLQEKIRKLETDRNFHQEECERCRNAHEQYKREVESQLEQDRARHRAREAELQGLIAKASEERAQLQQALEQSQGDVGGFRTELEAVVEKERRDAVERERRAMAELDQYRGQISADRAALDETRKAVEKLRAERDLLRAGNQRLESTVRDMMSVGGDRTALSARGSRHADPSSATQPRHLSPRREQTSVAENSRRFQSPTVASRQRGADTSREMASRRAPSRPRPLHRETPSHMRSGCEVSRCPTMHQEPLDDVYAALEEELTGLHAEYKRVIKDASDPDGAYSPVELTQKLNSITVQIDRKSEQLRLLRISTTDSRRVPNAKGFSKAIKKQQLMTSIRSMTKP